MKRVRLILGCCLVLGLAPACSSGDTDGDSPGAGGKGGGSSGAASGGSTATAGKGGTEATAAGTSSAGQTASAGTDAGGSGGSSGGSGGSAGSGTAGGGNDEPYCKKSGVGCLCSNFPPQADDIGICTPQSVNGMCCASEATGFCSCRQWSCENDSLGCSCGSNTDGPLKKCTGVFGVCCLTVIGTASNCYCDDLLTECVGANDVKVANCDIAIAPCGQGETEVDACKP